MTLGFVNNTENYIFFDYPCIGKTNLYVAFGMWASYSETSLYYITAVKLAQLLGKHFFSSSFPYHLATYAKFLLVTMDEIGYSTSAGKESHLFFQFVSSR